MLKENNDRFGWWNTENTNRKQSRNEQRTHEKGNKKQKTKAEASNQSSHLFHSSAVFVVLFLLPPLRLFSSPAQSLYLQMFSLLTHKNIFSFELFSFSASLILPPLTMSFHYLSLVFIYFLLFTLRFPPIPSPKPNASGYYIVLKIRTSKTTILCLKGEKSNPQQRKINTKLVTQSLAAACPATL